MDPDLVCQQLKMQKRIPYYIQSLIKLIHKVSVMIEHDRITMTIPTSIPCGDGFLAHIVKYFNLNYFNKTETNLYHNYMILKLCRHK